MGKDTKNSLTIDGVEYDPESFTDEQKMLVNHVIDLDRKLNSARFNLDQLSVGRETFLKMLKESLDKPESVN
jgi:hypothetical protein